MIERLAIHNFRCFDELEIAGLRRINMVVGHNASGKTAFLESLMMCAGAAAPNVVFQLRAFRQLGAQLQVSAETSAYEALWQDLFHWLDQNKTVTIAAMGDRGDSRVLRIFYIGVATQTLPFGEQPLVGGLLPQIVFEWQRGNNTPLEIKPKLTPLGLQIEGASIDHFPIVMFGPHVADPPDDNAKRFSELSKSGRIQPVIEALRSEFSFIESLSIEYSNGIPMVFASFVGQKKKLPIGLVSDGVNRLLSILLAIASFARGIVLIDEFENGFHYKTLASIWKIV